MFIVLELDNLIGQYLTWNDMFTDWFTIWLTCYFRSTDCEIISIILLLDSWYHDCNKYHVKRTIKLILKVFN